MPESDQRPRSFASFYRTTLEPLRRYLGRLLGNRADAQDVAHDAYSRVYRAMDREPVAHPEGLLFTTARRLAINQLRRRGNSPVQNVPDNVVELFPTPAPGVERVVMARQEWAETEAAIARLPAGCRAVFLLCRFEGLTHAAAAARLGISPKTVEKQHARALRLLRASLRPAEAASARAAGKSGAAGG